MHAERLAQQKTLEEWLAQAAAVKGEDLGGRTRLRDSP
jgi:hypothetical protein